MLISKKNILYFIISSLSLLILLLMANLNGRFIAADFEVYYFAAKAFLSNKQVYNIAFGDSTVGFFKYTPFTILLYIPATVLPIAVAKIINYMFISLCIIFTIYLSSTIVLNDIYCDKKIPGNALLLITFLLSITFFNREVMLGNTNVFLLFSVCLVVGEKYIPWISLKAFFYAFVIIFKPYLLIITLPLIANRRFKVLAYISGFLLVFLCLPFAYTGIKNGMSMYAAWIEAFTAHNSYINSPFTLDSILKNYLLGASNFDFTFVFIAIVVVGYFIMKLYQSKIEQSKDEQKQMFVLESFILLALIPNLVNTDRQQLLFSVPLIAFVLHYLLKLNKNKLFLFLMVVLFFFFSVDQPDLLGRETALLFYRYGIAGISNLILISISLYIFFLLKKSRIKTFC